MWAESIKPVLNVYLELARTEIPSSFGHPISDRVSIAMCWLLLHSLTTH